MPRNAVFREGPFACAEGNIRCMCMIKCAFLGLVDFLPDIFPNLPYQNVTKCAI